MTDSSSDKTWGAFAPVMPSFIRLIAGVIVLVVFMIGLIVCFVILKFGTQLATTVSDAYKSYRTWTPLLAYFFQIVAIGIVYAVTKDIAQPYFSAEPWAFPLMFLLIALIPTIKVVVNMVHALEGPGTTKKSQSQNY